MHSPTKSNNNTLKKSNSNAKLQKRREGSVSSATTRTDPDSGYDSPTSPKKRLSSLRKDNVLEDQEIDPVPVVWANGTQPQHPETDDEEDAGHHQYDRTPRSRSVLSHTHGDGVNVRRSQSMRSYRTGRDDQGSIRTTPSRASARRKSLSGGTFANGPGTIGPNAKADEEETKLFRARSVHAEAGLTKKEKAKLGKVEIKEGKRMAKVIKQEAKIEKKVLEQSVRDLAELQKIQKYAVKEEAKTNAAYAQALKVFHKEELAFLAARAKFERAQADLQCYEDAREAARDHARDATEMLQEKNREIEWLRAQKHADDRERELKLRQLAGKAL
ncbi:hypothetical protein BC629DRAFT_1290256 [Irpex lacteus]|nr:hypothetical protein BC629DRAFT_1297625 [Irpex lacteus]KAI0777093.1 hypothetical protein BC629DRAFT_1290256 [Irpex lacteus]